MEQAARFLVLAAICWELIAAHPEWVVQPILVAIQAALLRTLIQRK